MKYYFALSVHVDRLFEGHRQNVHVSGELLWLTSVVTTENVTYLFTGAEKRCHRKLAKAQVKVDMRLVLHC